MIHLVYSNRTEELVAELAARVRRQQLASGALAAVSVVVPNATVDAYLRLGVARECGIAANLRTMLMTRFAAAEAGPGATVATAVAFEAMALALLLDEGFVAERELEPVRAYVGAVESREAADVRRVQLASRVGRLFEQYTFSRPDLLTAWGAGRGALDDGPHAEAERWQRRLWVAMFGEGGLGRKRGLAPLHEAVAALPGAAPPEAQGTLHVFGFAHFASTFHELLARVARSRDIVVYGVSPCEGFWEDFDPADPALIQLWGRPGREHVRALNALAGFDHDDRFVEPPGDTLLAQLQRDVLRRAPAREQVDPAFAFERDGSLVVLEHASVRRELEAVASEIWRLAERDESLRFDAVALLLPDQGAQDYLAHLPAVFREAHDLPHQLVDVPPLGGGHVVDAVELLLTLPLGRFGRRELLRLAVHPAVVASLDDVDAARWLPWCDALGIVHGADRSDHAGTYIERDILNWDQGLRRLALGAFMAGDATGERRPFELAGEAYVPHEVGSGDMRDAAALGLLVRSLVADARFVQQAVLGVREWAALLVELVSTYVTPTDDEGAEALVDCLRRLHGLGEVDLGDRRVPYAVACELARARVAVAPRARGVQGGVVVSRIGSVRPIPFLVVFACGLGEGRFPCGEAEDALDLRWARRRAGDVTSRERDRYAFLDLLLQTRDRLVLSYVSRDPLTGDAIAPSSVVDELLHVLRRGYVRDDSALRHRHPLRRWDPHYFPDLFGGAGADEAASALGTTRVPEARAEARALALRRSLEAHGGRPDPVEVQARAAADPAWARLADHLAMPRVPDASAPADGRVAVPMYALVKFLEFPLQGWARFRVGLDELEDDDALAREDEPFETDARRETLLLRRVFLDVKGGSLERAYDEVVRDRELRGSGPSGVFARAERGEHLHTLEGWRDDLRALEISPEDIEVHRFGRAHPPLTMDVDVTDASGVTRVVRVEIGGRTLPLGGPDVSITLSRRVNEGKDDWAFADRQRALLRAFVDHAVLAASAVAGGRKRASVVLPGAASRGAEVERVDIEPMSQGEALVWLRDVVRELLGGPHAYFFPCEALFVDRRRRSVAPLVAALEEARDLLRGGDGPPALRSAYGPVPRVHEYPIPPEADARAMAARRFGALFGKCGGDT